MVVSRSGGPGVSLARRVSCICPTEYASDWRREPSMTMKRLSHKFCVAPMMDWTDRHCRAFHRLLTRHALLYTEMVTAAAILHGDRTRLLGMSGDDEHPVALQLGGS